MSLAMNTQSQLQERRASHGLHMASQVARFDPVSLTELVAEAALLTRIDRKYLIPEADAAALLGSLDANTRVLEMEGERGFRYDSVYFDTPDHLAYRLTETRRRRRFKLRTRSYLDTGGCFLEVKTKGGRGHTLKRRIAYDPAHRTQLNAEGRDFVTRVLSEEGFAPELTDQVAPSLMNTYRRSTLLLSDGSRATIDSELQWQAVPGHAYELEGYVIVESKSVGAPSELDRALWYAGHRPQNVSKFGTGTAALHPELPSNKWARILGTVFASANNTATDTALQPSK